MNETQEVMTHLTTGAVIVYLIEWLKAQGWCRWVTADTGTVNRAISAIGAAAVAFGISAQGDAQSGWTIHIPSLAVLLLGVWEWVKQFTLQQLLFDGVVQKSGRPVTVTKEFV